MTYEKLSKIIEINSIPRNVELLSDSGWEYDPTQMDGVYYNKRLNRIIFTQSCSEYKVYDKAYKGPDKERGYVALTDEEGNIKENITLNPTN